MAAVELDVARLSAFCSLPPTSIETLLDAPTVELVRSSLVLNWRMLCAEESLKAVFSKALSTKA